MKVYKPDSRVYELPIKKYDINADEITFLSANTWDVSGAEIMAIILFGLIEVIWNLTYLTLIQKMKLKI